MAGHSSRLRELSRVLEETIPLVASSLTVVPLLRVSVQPAASMRTGMSSAEPTMPV